MKPFSIFLLSILSIPALALAMSKPPPGSASGRSYEFGYKQFLGSKNDSWSNGVRAGANIAVFTFSYDNGFAGSSSHVRYSALNFGIGSGPLQLAPLESGLRPFGRFNFVGLRWRDGRFASYSGTEAGVSRSVSENFGWFTSLTFDYPGFLGVPSALYPETKKSDEIRKKDGIVGFLTVGVAFDPSGAKYASDRETQPQQNSIILQ